MERESTPHPLLPDEDAQVRPSAEGNAAYAENLKQARQELEKEDELKLKPKPEGELINAKGKFTRKIARDNVKAYRDDLAFRQSLSPVEISKYYRMTPEEKKEYRKQKESEPKFE